MPLNDDDKLSPEEVILFFGDMMKKLSARYGVKRAMEMFNEACRRAGVEARVEAAEPDKPS